MAKAARGSTLRVVPLTPDRWSDFTRLFGERGACAGCWCMFPRRPRSAWERGRGEGNRRAMKRLVESGPPPGLLGYVGDEPIAWCSIEPRERIGSLARSRVLAPVDDAPVWSIVCFFVARPWRGRGLTPQIVEAAVAWARRHGATIVEGYPVAPAKGRTADAFAWTGLVSTFEKAGFREVARRSPTRPIMRRTVKR